MTDNETTEPTDLVPVMLTIERWKRVAACLDWHGKDHESELIVDSIREQTGDV